MSAVSKFLSDIEKTTNETVVELNIDDIREFGGENRKHAFKILDAKVKELAESIKEFGVVQPIIVRVDPEGITKYECLAGHHRIAASKLAEKTIIPAIIRKVETDEEANQIMVTSNRQRESLLPSEKAYMYKYEYEAIKHQGVGGGISLDILAEESIDDDSKATIKRYIKLADLNQDLLDMVDSKKLNFYDAIELSYLQDIEQTYLYAELAGYNYKITNEIAIALKDNSKMINRDGKTLTREDIKDIITANTFEEEKVKRISFSMPQEALEYFPKEADSKEKRAMLILKLLELHKEELKDLI